MLDERAAIRSGNAAPEVAFGMELAAQPIWILPRAGPWRYSETARETARPVELMHVEHDGHVMLGGETDDAVHLFAQIIQVDVIRLGLEIGPGDGQAHRRNSPALHLG